MLQACAALQKDNEQLQEKLDELTADVYLLRQENAHLKQQQNALAEVCSVTIQSKWASNTHFMVSRHT